MTPKFQLHEKVIVYGKYTGRIVGLPTNRFGAYSIDLGFIRYTSLDWASEVDIISQDSPEGIALIVMSGLMDPNGP